MKGSELALSQHGKSANHNATAQWSTTFYGTEHGSLEDRATRPTNALVTRLARPTFFQNRILERISVSKSDTWSERTERSASWASAHANGGSSVHPASIANTRTQNIEHLHDLARPRKTTSGGPVVAR